MVSYIYQYTCMKLSSPLSFSISSLLSSSIDLTQKQNGCLCTKSCLFHNKFPTLAHGFIVKRGV